MRTHFYKLGQQTALEELGLKLAMPLGSTEKIGTSKNAADKIEQIKDIAIPTTLAFTAGPLASGLYHKAIQLEKLIAPPLNASDIAAIRKTLNIAPHVQHVQKGPEHASYAARGYKVRTGQHGAASSIAHEFGHASGKPVPLALSTPFRKYTRLAPLAALPLMTLLDPESTTAKTLPWLAGAPFLPQLAEEARATTKGLYALQKLKKGRLGALTSLIPAFGSYLAPAAAMVGGMEWIRRNR